MRLTDADHTDAVIMKLVAGEVLTLTLPMEPDSFVYIGTDLPDPVANYPI